MKENIPQPEASKSFRYMTRKDIAAQLHITLPTLHEWTKLGLIKSYRIGSPVLFRSDDINESIR